MGCVDECGRRFAVMRRRGDDDLDDIVETPIELEIGVTENVEELVERFGGANSIERFLDQGAVVQMSMRDFSSPCLPPHCAYTVPAETRLASAISLMVQLK